MTKKSTIKRPYPRVQVYEDPGVSMTEQHHARSCDINTIMAKYQKTGVLEHLARYEPTFGDVSDLDFKRAMDTVAAVKSEFHDLPAFVRDHFDQDEAAYLAAVSTPEGLQEIRELVPESMQYDRDGNPEPVTAEPKPAQPATEPAEPAEGDKPVT